MSVIVIMSLCKLFLKIVLITKLIQIKNIYKVILYKKPQQLLVSKEIKILSFYQIATCNHDLQVNNTF